MGNIFAGFSAPGRGLVVAAAIAIIIAATRMAGSLLAPLLLAIFTAIVLTPMLGWMGRHRIPKWLSLLVILFLLMDLGSLMLLMTTGALEGLRDSLPSYQERFLLLSSQMGDWLEGLGLEGSSAALPDIFDPNEAMRGVRFLLSNVGSLAATGVLVLMAVIFLLLETASLPDKLKLAFRITPGGEARLQGLLSAINRYMIIKSMTSLATAFLIGVWLWLLGLDFIVVWVVLAFLLNFVPFVGSIFMAIPTLLFALVNHDIGTVLWVAVAYLAANVLIGNILEPRIMGQGLGISTFVVFLSLLFWGWVLGTIGVFLSVPLTMALMTALDASPQTRPIAILMGPPVPAAEEAAA